MQKKSGICLTSDQMLSYLETYPKHNLSIKKKGAILALILIIVFIFDSFFLLPLMCCIPINNKVLQYLNLMH